jgi:type IV pilus assembly protein PilQ
VRQVLIEARIVEASDTFGKSLGVRLGGVDLRARTTRVAAPRVTAIRHQRHRGPPSPAPTTASRPRPARPTTAFDTSSTTIREPAGGRRGWLQPRQRSRCRCSDSGANRFLNLELSALEADGRGKLVSSPRVVTADKTKALIEQGTEFPYQQATSSGATSVAFRKAT